MKKGTIIFISTLLILAAVLIYFLSEHASIGLDEEWIGFFTGLCFGTGITLPLSLLKKKSKS